MAIAVEKRIDGEPVIELTAPSDRTKKSKGIFAKLDDMGSVIVHAAIVLILLLLSFSNPHPREGSDCFSPLESDVALTKRRLKVKRNRSRNPLLPID